MMKIIKVKNSLCLLVLCSFSLYAYSPLSSSCPRKYQDSDIWDTVEAGEYSLAIQRIDSWLEKEKDLSLISFLQVEKSKLLYANQQHVEALELFLDVIEKVVPTQSLSSKEEDIVFNSLFPLYEGALASHEECEKFVETSKKAYAENPSFSSLELYICAGLANCGRFCEFFDAFFHAYQSRSDSFLAWKILGVIHLRLYEASSNEAVRALHREKAVFCLRNAFKKRSEDGTILVKMVFITPKEERQKLFDEIIEYLEAMHTPLRRSECFFLIEEALQARAVGFAKRCIVKAQSWYSYSRALRQFTKQIETLESSS